MADSHLMNGSSSKVPDTSGHVLRGLKARYYDFGNRLFGVPLVNRAHVHLISIDPGQSLLDIGCGTGEVLHQLHEVFGDGVEMYGVDPSDEILDVARRKLSQAKNVSIELGAGERLRFAEGAFDWVVSSLTLHHLPLPTKRAMVAEAHRVLKPGGRLLLSDFGKPTHLAGQLLAAIWSGHAFTREHLGNALRQIILEQGFSDLSISVQGGVIHHTLARKAFA